ncbi:MAG: YdcF family protein [Xanthomonadaceae bacterium]|nr:YdcF family protein [Xanthomonadaceae bacterium]
MNSPIKNFSLITAGAIGVMLGIFLIAFTSAGLIYEYYDSVELDDLPKNVDGIVVLAGAKGRISEAADLWLKFYKENPSRAPMLYVSGMGQRSNWSVFVAQVRPEVLRVIREKDVILETQSTTTEENALWLQNSLNILKWDHIVLITSNYHMRRSLYIFQTILGNTVDIDTYSVQPEPYRDGKWYKDAIGIQITLSEFFKWLIFRTFVRS